MQSRFNRQPAGEQYPSLSPYRVPTDAQRARRFVCRLAFSNVDVTRRVLRSNALFCETDDEAFDAVRSTGIAGLVWEASDSMTLRSEPIPQDIIASARGVPLLLLTDMRFAETTALIALASTATHLQVSLVGFHDLARELSMLARTPPERDAEQAIVGRIAHLLLHPAIEIVLVAAIAAKKRTTVAELATLCGLSEGAIEYRLRVAHLPPAWMLLGRFLSLHTAWRCGVLRWPLKRAAAEAGLSPSRLGNYVERHAGARPLELARRIGFRALLDRFAEDLREGR